MNQRLAKKILDWCGWKIIQNINMPNKCVVCIAPHTSNWDFFYGMLFKYATKTKANFFMKKEWFKFPLGKFMRNLGGIPIDRSKNNSITDSIAKEFSLHDKLCIGLTPEGTRSYTTNWKKGFYYIAQKANVPLILAYIDYQKKEVGFDKEFLYTGNIEHDMQEIKQYYSNISAKYPEKFGY